MRLVDHALSSAHHRDGAAQLLCKPQNRPHLAEAPHVGVSQYGDAGRCGDPLERRVREILEDSGVAPRIRLPVGFFCSRQARRHLSISDTAFCGVMRACATLN